jgi:hypothetical protein
VHGAGQLREALHVAALLEDLAVHARREAHRFRSIGTAEAVDQALEGGDHVFELAAAAIKAVNAHVDQKAGFEKPVQKEVCISM